MSTFGDQVKDAARLKKIPKLRLIAELLESNRISSEYAKKIHRLGSRIEALESWIEEEGMRTDACTYDILWKQCRGCACDRFKASK